MTAAGTKPATARSPLLTVAEVGARLRISKSSAYRIVKEMEQAVITGPIRIDEGEVERYIAAHLRGPVGGRPRPQWIQNLAAAGVAAIAALPSCCTTRGFTYLVAASGLIKIGCSRRSLAIRLAGLQAQSPLALQLLLVSRGADLEPILHEHCRQWRAHSEWFSAAGVDWALAESKDRASDLRVCLRCAWDMRETNGVL